VRLKESLDEIFKLGGRLNQPAKYGLENIKGVLDALGNPESKVPYFHVTGTKGKGSTTNFITSILKRHGYKVGMYVSPSLFSTLERININGELISPKEFVLIWEALWEILKNLDREKLPSTFETFTIIAFLYFLKNSVDFGVIEVGLGGRLDATNVIKSPLVSVITDISFDHQKYLGNTLKEIAFEKSKIIKENRPVVIGVKDEEAKEVILNEAKINKSPYFILGKDFEFRNIKVYNDFQVFDFVSLSHGFRLNEIKLHNLGYFEIIDASIAIQSILVSNVNISKDDILMGIESSFWPGRFEVIHKNPLVIIDGAHNDASSKILSDTIKNLTDKKITLLFSMLSDKNVFSFLSNIKDIVDKLVITTVPNSYSRALNPYEIYNTARLFFKESMIDVIENPRKAYFDTKDSLKEDDILLITGSLYLVGFVRSLENIFTFGSKLVY